LDPTWDGYSMPPGHDVQEPDADLSVANLVTSEVRDKPGFHRILLDLDYGASVITLGGITRLRANCNPGIGMMRNQQELKHVMDVACIPRPGSTPQITSLDGAWKAMLEIDIDHPIYFGPSSTKGHYHAIIAHDIPWSMYTAVLTTLSTVGVIQPGYAKASIKKGYAALRPPWVRK